MSALKTVLYKNKTLQDGSHPVRLRVYFGKERYISLGLSARPSEWNAKKCVFNKKATNYEEKNARLRKRFNDAEKILNDLLATNKPFSFTEFKSRFLNQKKTKFVLPFIQEIMVELEAKGQIGNQLKYRQLYNRLKKFKGDTNLAFIDVDYNFLVKFETHILSKGVKKSTAHFYMRTLRATINEAIRRGLLAQEYYPFATQFKKGGYSFAHLKGNYDPKPIAREHIELIKHFDTSLYPHLTATRDLFMFMLKARGINFIDICYLTRENIQGNRLVYNRKKTGKRYSVLLSEDMRAILDKYMGKTYLFPILDDMPRTESARYHHIRKALKVFNDQLKEMAQILEIGKSLSSYTARYSYTDILIKNATPVQVIKQALGHSSIETTQHYIKAHSDEEVDKYDRMLNL